MARNKSNLTNIDKSDLINYPDGRIQNNLGAGNGTPVNEIVYGDLHEFFAKLMREYGIEYNGLPDNETNTYQLIEAARSLASKNDYVLDLNSSGGVLEIPLKLGKLKDNESFILRSTVNKGSETQIRGILDNVNKTVSFIGGDFSQNEYIRMINTRTSVVLIRLVDGVNLDTFTSALNYLKAATQTQENAGTANNVATTPLTNKTSFIRRVNGSDSTEHLAIQDGLPGARNGLLSSSILADIKALTPPRNVGFVSGIDPGTPNVNSNAVVGGDISAAVVIGDGEGATSYRVSMDNDMSDTNYIVRIDIQGLTSSGFNDSTGLNPSFKPISVNQFEISFVKNTPSASLNMKAHLSIIQL